MKSNKLFMIVLPAAAVLIGIICIVTSFGRRVNI